MEQRFKSKWRKKMNIAEQQRFSCFKRIVVSCGDDRDRIGHCENVFKRKQSVKAMVEMIEKEGWVAFKSRKDTETNEE